MDSFESLEGEIREEVEEREEREVMGELGGVTVDESGVTTGGAIIVGEPEEGMTASEPGERVTMVGEPEEGVTASEPEERVMINERSTYTLRRASRRLKVIQGLLQELSTPTGDETIEVNDDREESQNTTGSTAERLAWLYRKASRAGRQEILDLYRYGEVHKNKIYKILSDERITEKTARSRLYKAIIRHLPGITMENLRKKTQKARNIYRLFREIGVDKIRRIKSYSADAISSFTGVQIQIIIDHFSS
jgi:hypothetical protein